MNKELCVCRVVFQGLKLLTTGRFCQWDRYMRSGWSDLSKVSQRITTLYFISWFISRKISFIVFNMSFVLNLKENLSWKLLAQINIQLVQIPDDRLLSDP